VASDDFFTLAALQLIPSQQLSDTITTIDSLIKSLISQEIKPDCIVLPEYCFGSVPEWKIAGVKGEDYFLQVWEKISSLCRKHRVAMVAGSMPYKTHEGMWHNRSYLFSSRGKVLGEYDKQRPFRMEKKLGLQPGDRTPIFKLGQLRLAILVCADLWSAWIVQQVASKIDFLAVPTMTTVLDEQLIGYGRWAWQSLVAVRSKEFTVPIMSADQAIRSPVPGTFTCGASCIADPSHRFRAGEESSKQALKVTQPTSRTALVSTISKKKIEEYRSYRRDVGLRD
jgi:predicted amidohydrolase